MVGGGRLWSVVTSVKPIINGRPITQTGSVCKNPKDSERQRKSPKDGETRNLVI